VDREMLVEHLARATVNVADAKLAVARQKLLIGALSRDGHPTIGAKQFLHALEINESLHVACRNRLKQELLSANSEWEYLPAPRCRKPRETK
jgi:hypothetical protein